MLLRPSDQFMDFRQCSEIPNRTAQRAERGQHAPRYGFQFWTHRLIIYRKATIRSVSKLESYLSSSFTSQCSTASPGREDLPPKAFIPCRGFRRVCFGSFLFLPANNIRQHAHIIIRRKAVLFSVSANKAMMPHLPFPMLEPC